MGTIRQWLEKLGFKQYTEAFEKNAIEWDLLPHLTDELLEKIGVGVVGHRMRILLAIKELSTAPEGQVFTPSQESPSTKKKTTPTPFETPSTQPPNPVGEAEHRQLTVMFCDLVGSTELSTRFDPEVLREMMGAYQTAAGAVIDSYDGHVAQYLGDGLMVYFGWPHAHEDDAERAVRAGLEVVEAVRSLDVPTELSVRVGIATGPVVVGETGGGDPSVPKTAVGATPNLAARVQGSAKPNTVAISGNTRGLIGGAFELDELGLHPLKGIAEPVEIFRVLEDKRAESSFEATYADHLTPLVGRNTEIAMQLDRWQRAKDGEGQVILLNGEPGIGKSRLIHMLHERLAENSYTPIRYQCSTHHSNSAFYPVIAQLERAAGFVRDDTSDNKLDKLEALLKQSTTEIDTVAPLFASLLSLPGDRYQPIEAMPQQQKEQTVAALNDQLLGLASRDPVLFLIEDVQWCDPTTLESLGDAIARIVDARVLMVITYRPEFEPPWTGHAHVSLQTLNRLSRREGTEVVGKVAGGKSLPREVLDLIVAKTDGIPLYVEELTKNVLEAGFLRDAGDHYELDGPLPSLAIPTTLQESLIARLDRLNTVKAVAQIGACIGREFSQELVATVSPLPEPELEKAFQQLIEAQIILRQGSSTHGSYIFKHAMLQDAAYASLLKGPRRQFHDRIADGLLSRFPDVVANTPELLASHLARAERFEEAVNHWREAGLRSKSASANQEAAHHFQTALEFLEKEAPSLSRDKRELELQAPLAVAMTALHGYASRQAGSVYERAFALTQNVESPPELFPIMYGLSINRLSGDRFTEGLSIAKELVAYVGTVDDKARYAMAHRWYGAGLIFLPDYEQSKMHLENAIAAYEELNSPKFTDEYGHDPKALGLVFLAWAQILRGYPDQGIALAQEAVSFAETLDFPYGLAHVHFHTGNFFKDLNDLEQTAKHADAQLQIASDRNFSLLENSALILSGWAEHCQNNPESLAKMERGFAQLKITGSAFFLTMLVNTHIDALMREHHHKAAKQKIQEALLIGETAGYRWNFPELHRIKAVCGLAEMKPNLVEVEVTFLEALELAKTQKAKLWELRTAVSLARLWGDEKERQKAYDLLFPVYDWYTEGFGTADLREAKILLEQLQ